MLFSEVIDAVLMDIDEDRTDKAILSKVQRYINRAYMELSKREGLEKTVKVTPKEGIIKLPEDFSRIYEVTYQGNIMPYTIRGKELVCNTEKEVLVTYNYCPEKLENEGDELETSEMNIEFVIAYTKYLYFSSEQETEAARAAKNEMNEIYIYTHNRNSFIKPIFKIMEV